MTIMYTIRICQLGVTGPVRRLGRDNKVSPKVRWPFETGKQSRPLQFTQSFRQGNLLTGGVG